MTPIPDAELPTWLRNLGLTDADLTPKPDSFLGAWRDVQAQRDPCAGHLCDRCAICRSGRCCGRDTARQPAPKKKAIAQGGE